MVSFKQGGGDILERLHNLKDSICDFENLMGAYREAIKDKRYRNEILDFGFNLSENLKSIQEDLLNMTYTVGRYREFYVRYPKPRLVMALGFRDRVVQWAIYRQINPYLDKRYINHSYGCRKGKGTLPAAQRLQSWQQLISRKPDAREWYIIKGDISKYFYRVDHKKVIQSYEEISDDPWFVWLISTIINNPDVPFGLPVGVRPDDCPRSERIFEVGMPIGNLTSQETANLFLDKLDQYCKHVLRLHFYIRYMDDFCILIKGKHEAWEAYDRIKTFLKEELLLDISPKSRIQKATDPVEFVGYLLTPHGIRMRKKTTRHMKKSLRHIMEAYADGRMSFDAAMESVTCYWGMTKHVNGRNMRRWIEDNFMLQRKDKGSNEPPGRRRFYYILENEDGTVDVYLRPDVIPAELENKAVDYDIAVLVVRDVLPFDGMEEDIREHYEKWLKLGEIVYL